LVSGVDQSFRRHYGQIYRYVRRCAGNPTRAEDLTQEVFADAVAAERRAPSSDGPSLPGLYTVARRRFADDARVLERSDRLLRAVPPPTGADAELATALRSALSRLAAPQREVLTLKLLRGGTFAEIAERLGTSEAAAKMRFVRALRLLRAELIEEGVQP